MQACGKFPKDITEICDGIEVLIPSRVTDVRDSEVASVRNSPVRHTGHCHRRTQPLSDRRLLTVSHDARDHEENQTIVFLLLFQPFPWLY